MTKTQTSNRLSCSTKNFPQTLPLPQTFLNRLRGPMALHLLAGGISQGSTNVLSVTNALSITLSSSSTSGSTAACSRTTALSVGGRSEQPLCWLVTGCGSVKTRHTFALNAATVFPLPWKSSDTAARNEGATTTACTAERAFQSPAA